ncbi:LuxR C-terminal-related transcriptional regulator [Saccharomonospora sp. NPDC046836]|uniref:helix-turn-helix transcriptional regulator n=1 Tax=Saccharomonospora sp. NPDC046836 TaxID=3156921 RepID=UPI00340DD34D
MAGTEDDALLPNGKGPPTDSTSSSNQGLSAQLHRIAGARDWDALEQLCDRYWLALPDLCGPDLVTVFEQIPSDVLQSRPRLLVAWISAFHLSKDTDSKTRRPYLRGLTDVGEWIASSFDPDTETSAATLAAVGTIVLITIRMRGDLEGAERYGQRLSERMAQLNPRPAAEPMARPGWIAFQRGLTRTLMADFGRAAEQYRQAHELARSEPTVFFAGLNGVANLAMIFAHLGHHTATEHWLDTMRSYPPSTPSVAFLLTVGGTIAEGWQALDRYDQAGVQAALEITGDGSLSIEVWPFVTALAAAHAVHAGRAVEYLDTLQLVQLNHAGVHTTQGMGLRVLHRALADLLIAAGKPNHALKLISEAGPDAHWLTVPAARLRLLNGDYEIARTLAARFQSHSATAHRDLLQLLLIKAAAALHMGEGTEAARAMNSAMRLRSPDEVLSLTTLPPADRAELFRIATVPLSDLAAERLAAAPHVFPSNAKLVDLTTRERAVLAELATGDTATQIARTLVVSVNTVRTQIQSIYRKLGASTRDEAIMRASELGIL